ncbi:MAG: saccharopine dehydrogenase C-terminal domain-containing protein [Holophaga sp.]|nr:saccharopine dehydrogenase C-terminal domain-containing protein [Holophaga sp.]
MRKLTILGAGRVGATVALDLARGGEFQVTVADRSDAALARLADRGITVRPIDLAPDNLGALVEGADLVVGAVPGSMGFATLEAVLAAGKPMVDISFFPEDPFRLDALAKAGNLVAVVDSGVAPGCDNLILGDLERQLDRVTGFECLVGGLPVLRTWPYEYKAGFSPADVLEEYTRPARYLEHGEEVMRPALSGTELVDLPGVGTLEAFDTDGLRTLLRTVAAPCMREKTLRYPGHAEKMRLLRATGLFERTPVPVGETAVAPLELTARLLFPLWQMAEGEEDFTVMRVTVEGLKDGEVQRHRFHLLDRYDRASGTTSMARTTGYTCTAMVRLVASGRYRRPGISPPEWVGREPGCWDFIRAELAHRGVLFTETRS